MRRAAVALLFLVAWPSFVRAARLAGPMDAVGMIDFTRGPRFKVGDWVKYRTQGSSEQGYKTDYTVTVVIGGEELWWGEECFWLETQLSYSGQAPEVAGSLVSYAVFQDSLPSVRFRRYIRKYFDGVEADGHAPQQIFQRAVTDIRTRGFSEDTPPWLSDTVGVEQVEVPMGRFDALRVNKRLSVSVTQQDGDSTVYFERAENHTFWWSDKIPITRLVRQDQESTQRRRVWMIGESKDAPMRIAERSTGATQLLDFGSGMKARGVPERLQRPLSEQKPAHPRQSPSPRPAAKRG